MVGIGGSVVAAGCLGSDDEDPSTENGSSDDDDGDGTGDSETITVDDTIQSAVDSAQSGDTIEIPEGTYEEFVRIETDLSLTATGDVVLEGANIEPEDSDDDAVGIEVDASDVSVAGVEIVGYADAAIATIESASSISVSDVQIADCVEGVVVEADEIVLQDSAFGEIDGAGASLVASRSGTVTVESVTVEDCGGNGVDVQGGESVTISDVQATANDRGVRIHGGDARDQTAEIRDVIATGNERGIVIEEASGDSERSLEHVEIRDGTGGIEVVGDTITLEDALVSDHSLGVTHRSAILLESSPDGHVTVNDIEVTDIEASSSNDKAGRGLTVIDGGEVEMVDIEITRAYGNVIHVETEDGRDRSVSITDAQLVSNGLSSAIQVDDAGGTNSIVLERIRTEDTVRGIEIVGDTVTVEEVDVNGVVGGGSPGIGIESTADGEVVLEDISVTGAEGGSSYSPWGRGVEVVDGESVTISDASLTQNYGDNLSIEADAVRDQSIQIESVFAETNTAGSGIVTAGSSGSDTVEITDCDSNNHAAYGFDIGGESISIENCSAADNDRDGLNLRDIDEAEANISGSNL
ncbi:right-handed parallel beta-helix repeat-containing protein [Natranaeroarchaeum sulfidigenes]|uniref:Secreted protein, with PKD repeat domain n=1 Tax=Natranaeroarchaeum sulfidigenes TaxID=2784880 RepID=A0A897MQI1_9EURY|nr:right-handed parallel beta-helix repeat-containing protein [Natranaeroarchaeum sulfidigenes]QSG02591.1 Secreted protein, with PKD repeat domain [Natranaeroarchaeum sulfidigenes]